MRHCRETVQLDNFVAGQSNKLLFYGRTLIKRTLNKKIKYYLVLLVHLSLGLTPKEQGKYSLDLFFEYNPELEHKVDVIFNSLNDKERVAQMIITSAGELGKDNKTVIKLTEENTIGGVCLLKGTRENHLNLINELNRISKDKKTIPLLFSMDAEPSLFNGRIRGTEKILNTIDIKTANQCDSIAGIISKELLYLGIRQNFSPVVDISPTNEAIKNRSFSNNKDTVSELSKIFVQTTQANGIIATAKHFPGHGLVKGDTHKQSVFIDGNLQELDMYKPLIESGVISIMIAHITIKNNDKYETEGLPASCSRRIVTDLLKEELGFKGLIITDAMNIMKAVTYIENAPLKASMAGCDMILMPVNEIETMKMILKEMDINEEYKQQVYQSVKKIIRLKICLGMI